MEILSVQSVYGNLVLHHKRNLHEIGLDWDTTPMTTGQLACYSPYIKKVYGGAYGVMQSSPVISLTMTC